MTDRELLAELEALCAALATAASPCARSASSGPSRYAMAEEIDGAARARASATRELTALPRMTSFSRLIADAEAGRASRTRRPRTSRDHDAHDGAAAGDAPARARREPPVVLHAFPTRLAARLADPQRVRAHRLPARGSERARRRGGAPARPLRRRRGAAPRCAGRRHRSRAADAALERRAAAARSRDIARSARVDELEFTLGARRGAPVTDLADLAALAELFARHRAPAVRPGLRRAAARARLRRRARLPQGLHRPRVPRTTAASTSSTTSPTGSAPTPRDYAQPQLVAGDARAPLLPAVPPLRAGAAPLPALRLPGLRLRARLRRRLLPVRARDGACARAATGVFFDRPSAR